MWDHRVLLHLQGSSHFKPKTEARWSSFSFCASSSWISQSKNSIYKAVTFLPQLHNLFHCTSLQESTAPISIDASKTTDSCYWAHLYFGSDPWESASHSFLRRSGQESWVPDIWFAVLTKIKIFWCVISCSLVDTFLHKLSETPSSSTFRVSVYQPIRCHIPKDCLLY